MLGWKPFIPLIDNKLKNESFLTDIMSIMDKTYKILILYAYFVYTLCDLIQMNANK